MTATPEPHEEPPAAAPGRLRAAWRRARGRWWSRWLIDLVFLSVVVLLLWAWQSRHLVAGGAEAPGFALTTLEGERVALDDFRGKKLVLIFWSPWCRVCQLDAGAFGELYDDARAGGDFAVASVMLSYGSRDEVADFVAEHQVELPVLLGDDAVRQAYAIESYPTIYVIDEDGRVEHSMVGYTTWLGLRARLAL